MSLHDWVKSQQPGKPVAASGTAPQPMPPSAECLKHNARREAALAPKPDNAPLPFVETEGHKRHVAAHQVDKKLRDDAVAAIKALGGKGT